ncbi:ComEC/Rec2 family competence protein [Pseudoruegeria sp. SK021]|uniref:ComEC/Rec2 family competence protein n=1 Tax=Pseudoruegeria sp. SK021 TaxID=1933035 RepID=UPI000A246FCD|nr:ComEC/Rec2 family competence protein [Pseudoruegeria sp. SK021]OSP56265.1 hypothetical protein BV911_02955 [Pseudoruegeria sp. SK021]
MARPARIGLMIAAQRGHLFVWMPVFLALGIGLFFSLRFEPSVLDYGVVAGLAIVLATVARSSGETLSPLLSAVVLILLGFLLAGARSHLRAAPVMEYRYYGAIEGRVIAVDRSQSEKPRLTLDQVVLERTSPARTPRIVRVSLHGRQGFIDPVPGLRVILTGHLSPPGGPVEPYGFDFQRMAWFQQLGAVGYTRTPVLGLDPPQPGKPLLALNRFRLGLSAAVQAQLPGQVGAFAAALVTGDRSGLTGETLSVMRDSNLAHLLAISGLHIGLLTAFVFAAVRYGIALVPAVALRVPAKKVGAILALFAALAYLGLSGGNVSTQRAFIMVAVMLCAVLLDRRALTLRSVALAALIVLVLAPESLLSPGFQMSFAATTALVWVFGEMRSGARLPIPKWARGVLSLIISSAVAGIATAPIAAAHFNQSATYGLIANLLTVPLMGSVVIPAAVLAACLSPFGLGWVGLWIMGVGIRWILGVATAVSKMDGAVRLIPQPPPMILPMMILGLIWIILWQGRLRLVGLIPTVLAVWLWIDAERPYLLISDTATLVGVMTPGGRALNKPKGDGFAAEGWLENDGDRSDRDTAFQRAKPYETGDGFQVDLGAARLTQMAGRALTASADPCNATTILIASKPVGATATCLVLDPEILTLSGALALRQSPVAVQSVRQVTGYRLWNSRDLRAGRPHRVPELERDAQVILDRIMIALTTGSRVDTRDANPPEQAQ